MTGPVRLCYNAGTFCRDLDWSLAPLSRFIIISNVYRRVEPLEAMFDLLYRFILFFFRFRRLAPCVASRLFSLILFILILYILTEQQLIYTYLHLIYSQLNGQLPIRIFFKSYSEFYQISAVYTINPCHFIRVLGNSLINVKPCLLYFLKKATLIKESTRRFILTIVYRVFLL